jgi:creatinine amidohydrolase
MATRKYNAIGSAWLGALTWEEAGRALERLPVVIPVGGAAVEHGPHLPYDTDRVITTALADAVAERTPVLIAPPIDYVYAPEAAGQGGTLSLGPDAFMGLVSDVLRSLARHDARHVLLIERGSGLTAALNVVSREIHEEFGITVAVATGEGLAHELRAELLAQPAPEHAGELETSLMLALAPERVRLERAVTQPAAKRPAGTEQGLREPLVIYPPRGTDAYGDPKAATAEKGARIFAAMVDELVAHIEEVTGAWEIEEPIDWAGDVAAPVAYSMPSNPAGVLLGDLTSAEWPEVAARCEVAVLPMGAASKEHGLHMPNQTDLLTAEALAVVAVERLPILLLPPLGYGYYPAFIDWPGSTSIAPTTYRAVVDDVIGCLVAAGLRKIVLLDTGISTRPVLEIAAREAMRVHGVHVALVTTELGRETARELFDGEGSHANEDETALMLAIAPAQVDLSRARPEGRPATVFTARDPFAAPAFIQGGKMESATGVFGDPTKATAENGRTYFAAKTADLLAFLEDFIALKG